MPSERIDSGKKNLKKNEQSCRDPFSKWEGEEGEGK